MPAIKKDRPKAVLFIHKGVGGIRNDRKERTAIAAHVARRTHQARKKVVRGSKNDSSEEDVVALLEQNDDRTEPSETSPESDEQDENSPAPMQSCNAHYIRTRIFGPEKRHYVSSSVLSAMIPLHMFPIDAGDAMLDSFKYYSECWAPACVQRISHRGKGRDNALLQEYLRRAATDATFFQGAHAISDVVREKTRSLWAPITPKTRQEYFRTAKMLAERIARHEEAFDDLLPITITHLMAIVGLDQDWTSIHLHMRGLLQVITTRKSTSSSILAEYNHEVISEWTGFCSSLARLPERMLEASDPARYFHYPPLPFSPKTCTLISSFPPGFSNLALKGHLSTQSLRLLATILSPQPPSPVDLTALIVTFLRHQNIPVLEHLLILALLAYLIDRRGALPWLMNGYTCVHALYLSGLPLGHLLHPFSPEVQDTLWWVTSMFTVVFDDLTPTYVLGTKLAAILQAACPVEDFTNGPWWSFLWDEEMEMRRMMNEYQNWQDGEQF